MTDADSIKNFRSTSPSWSRWVPSFALAMVPLFGALVWFAWYHEQSSQIERRRTETSSMNQAKAENPEELTRAVRNLERRSSVLEGAFEEGQRRVEVPIKNDSEVVKGTDPQTPEEAQEALYQTLDAAMTDTGNDAREVRAAAATLRGELSDALAGTSARLAGLDCAAALCRTTIEQDLGDTERVSVAKLVESTPSLKSQGMVKYESDGKVNRTTIYAARVGQMLPLPRAEAATP
jgi:hypothetical protein